MKLIKLQIEKTPLISKFKSFEFNNSKYIIKKKTMVADAHPVNWDQTNMRKRNVAVMMMMMVVRNEMEAFSSSFLCHPIPCQMNWHLFFFLFSVAGVCNYVF